MGASVDMYQLQGWRLVFCFDDADEVLVFLPEPLEGYHVHYGDGHFIRLGYLEFTDLSLSRCHVKPCMLEQPFIKLLVVFITSFVQALKVKKGVARDLAIKVGVDHIPNVLPAFSVFGNPGSEI